MSVAYQPARKTTIQPILAFASIECYFEWRGLILAKQKPSKLPSDSDALLARRTRRVLAPHIANSGPLHLRILNDPAGKTLDLPASAVQMLVRILDEMALGNAVTLLPIRSELTTQEAADLLQVSRPSLIQLLDQGKVAFRRVGTHRRVRLAALMDYRRSANKDRLEALQELAAYDQELGI